MSSSGGGDASAASNGKYGYSLPDVVQALEKEFGRGQVTHGADYVKSRCVHPDHDDEHPSMSVSERDGRVLVRCHAGCDQAETFAALHALMTERRAPVDVGAAVDPRRECTLAAYAAANKLPLEFLEGLGLRDQKYQGHRVMRIPYSDDLVRYRTALAGENRFRWKSGSKPTLYGLSRLREMKECAYVTLVDSPDRLLLANRRRPHCCPAGDVTRPDGYGEHAVDTPSRHQLE